MDDVRAFLAAVPLFGETLDDEQLRFLAGQSKPAFFRAGTRLMNQGDFGGAMFVIESGEVSVIFVDENAREQEVARLGSGEVVGEISLFTGDRRTATVAAVDNVEALKISKWSLERIFARAPELIDRFAAMLATRQAELNARAAPRTGPVGDFTQNARRVFTGLFGRG